MTNGDMIIQMSKVMWWLSQESEEKPLEHKGILPVPCTKVNETTVKDWFQKINEEMDELKAATLRECTVRNDLDTVLDGVDDDLDTDIAEEAADTITAITSMLEAMGINEEMRQEAQERVNRKNEERGRL